MTPDQSLFRAALLDASRPVPAGLSDGQNRPAGRRFSVYRNNVAHSLTEALHTGFPVIAKLLGPQSFDGIAGLYLRAHPPGSPLMMHFGQEFPEFLTGFEPLKHLGYLGDVARLELAMRASYHAADSAAIDPAQLQAVDTDALMQASLELAPSVRLIRSDWPVYDIWRYNTEPGAPKPQALAQDVLITRPDFDPTPHLLPAGGAVWIDTLLQRHDFETAHDLALQDNPGFDLASALGLLISGGAITKINLKDTQ